MTRETSAAERAAEAAARAAKAEAEVREYKENATSIPYAELNKNPEAFEGKIVTYTGQIFQNSIVTFWGKVTGTQTYKTQIGGETSVPEVKAKYVSG